jgi:MYXO-CTERM domain-containing protein
MERTLLTARANMRTTLLTALIVLALAPAEASAQMQVQILAFGGRPSGTNVFNSTSGQPVSVAECSGSTPIQFQLTNVPTSGVQTIDVWWSATGSTRCNMGSSRMMSSGTTPPCTFISEASTSTSNMATVTVEVLPSVLFGGSSACSQTTVVDRNIHFLAVTTTGDATNDIAAANYAFVNVVMDPVPPDAPSLSGMPQGDQQISVGFDEPDEPLYEARLYADPDGCSDTGTVTSTALVAGMTPDEGYYVASNMGATPTSVVVTGTQLGLAYDAYAAVGVVFVDRARNVSGLSNIVCVRRVEVTSFWERYCAERGLATAGDGGTGCSARYASCAVTAPGSSSRAAVAVLAPLGLALLTLVRRRRGSR